MADCKLALLETSFSPDKIRMVIELVPADGSKFDLPLEEAGKNLSKVANYARATFEVKASPVGPPEAGSQDDTGPLMQGDDEKAEKQAVREKRGAKLLDDGNKRVLETFESELVEAKKLSDKEHIAKAKANLQRVKDRIARQKEEAGTEA